MIITEEYRVYCMDKLAGYYYVFEDGSSEFSIYHTDNDDIKDELEKNGLLKSKKSKKHIPVFAGIMKDENRVSGTRKVIYKSGTVKVEKIPEEYESFLIYDRRADKGEEGYSPKDYSVPHSEGGRVIPDTEEWVSWYAFNKMDDGTYEAALDEAWYGGYGHNDGGTIHAEIPEEWLKLPYEEFLEKVTDLAGAARFGFTAKDLKSKPALKEFFGFE